MFNYILIYINDKKRYETINALLKGFVKISLIDKPKNYQLINPSQDQIIESLKTLSTNLYSFYIAIVLENNICYFGKYPYSLSCPFACPFMRHISESELLDCLQGNGLIQIKTN